jgi:hypothetical protein
VAYIPAEAIRSVKTNTSSIARISPGEPLHLTEMSSHWLLDWYQVQECGITVLGPQPATFVPSISPQDFVHAVLAQVNSWTERVKEATTPGFWAYVVLTMCRTLVAITHGEQASKRRAAECAAKNYPEWVSLIDRALQWREPTDGWEGH